MNKCVSFSKDTRDPPITSKCKCCGHRNISPFIRPLNPCLICQKPYCHQCLFDLDHGLICVFCDIGPGISNSGPGISNSCNGSSESGPGISNSCNGSSESGPGISNSCNGSSESGPGISNSCNESSESGPRISNSNAGSEPDLPEIHYNSESDSDSDSDSDSESDMDLYSDSENSTFSNELIKWLFKRESI